MGTSKVVLNGETLIDVTGDTVTSENLLTSYTATKADGEKAIGNLVLPTFETQSKTVTPTESQQTVRPDDNIDGLSSVVVNAISPTYVGTGVARRTATDLSASGLTVTVPQGYYASQVSKTVEDVVDNDPLTVSVNGTYTAPAGKGYSPVTVNVQPRKIEGTKVNFFDYDGTIVEQYTAAEFLAMESMPSNPSHYGLNAQGWNWSLADAKAQLTACPDGDLNIGQMYSTISGDTEIDITIESDRPSPYLYFGVSGTATIDWGDGSSVDTVTGTNDTLTVFTNHTYATAGDYTIAIKVVSGNIRIKGASNFYGGLLSDSKNFRYNRDYCNTITAIRIGNSVRIDTYAFTFCRSLRYITIPNSDSLSTVFPSHAFEYCVVLQHVTIPACITSLDNYAFRDCLGIESVSLPYGIPSTGTYAFSGCSSLSYVTIPYNVTSIGSNAFYGCRSLRKIAIPDTVTSIGPQSFASCDMLESLSFPSGITEIPASAFSTCRSIKSITWSGELTSIGGVAFGNCSNLRSVSDLGSITTIQGSTFTGCESLEELIIPSTVTTIGSSAFSTCYSLRTLTIPSGVTSIGGNAFLYCYKLMELHLLPVQPPALGTSAIQENTGMVIYVPQGSLEAYQQDTNWSAYASYMVEEST